MDGHNGWSNFKTTPSPRGACNNLKMFPEESSMPDLIVEQCIPNCNECPGNWINTEIQHQIICRCHKCKHGQSEKASLSNQAKIVANNDSA